MPARLCIAALAAALALAAPAAALAQEPPGAGDQQYSDPFGPQPAQTQTQPPAQPAPTPDHEAGDQGQAQGAPAQAAPAQPAPAQAAPAQAAPPPAPAQQTLPRTGFDVLPLAAAGVALLLAGLALWRRPHARR
jgi:LPXTG-motif cell wall-anchored protein